MRQIKGTLRRLLILGMGLLGEDVNLVVDGHKGVLWTYNESPKLHRAIKAGVEI